MVINPTVEIYLLDKQGKILGHALPPESVKTDSVDLGPVQILIDGGAQMPLRGTDPRNDEIKQLRLAFGSMANKIREQFEHLKETDLRQILS